MTEASRQPGWDKQTVNRIATYQYGDLRKMFDAHEWETNGRIISQIAPTKVVETYGSVSAFEKAHSNGSSGNALLNPLASITSDPPDVWLTSYYGYDPGNWGLFAFTDETDRRKFIQQSAPGALVVIYGTKNLDTDEAGLVLGVQQITHVTGPSEKFIAPTSWAQKQRDSSQKWNLGVKCVRAWEIPVEYRPSIEDFAPDTYTINDARTIGRRGKRMSQPEAQSLLTLPLFEIPVFGGKSIELLPPAAGEELLKPSRPGPVSQTGHWTREAEGPKHLYILHPDGNVDAFLGYPSNGARVVKVGFSHSPETRCFAHNGALPKCAFSWRVDFSTFVDGREPFASSGHAKAGEQAMKDLLESEGKSLGGEFFLADTQSIDRAWKAAIKAAEKWKP